MAHSVSHSHPIRVLLDGIAIPADPGGVGRYVDDLVPEPVEQGVDLTMTIQECDAEHFTTRLPLVRIVPISQRFESRPACMAREQTGLPKLIRKIRPDAPHFPHYTSPQLPGVPVVITLHDATSFSHPQAHSRLKQRFFTVTIRCAIRRVDALVVPPLATRDETIKYANGDPPQSYVAYHGVNHSIFYPVSDVERERVKASLGLEGRDYIGFLGTLEPRKNVPNLVYGWVKTVSGRPNPPAPVLASGKGWDEDIGPIPASAPEHLTALCLGYLPLENPPGFLPGCVVLTYPSIAEGFGPSVPEVMSCDAATLTVRLTSLPEVGGGVVAYCDVDPDSIAQVLTELLGDPARREALGVIAVPRVDEFAWTRVALVHIEAFRAAARS